MFFLTGADEHGSKIYNTAKDQGIGTEVLLDENVSVFQDLNSQLSISNDEYIRTTDQQRHWPTAQDVWRKLVESGDIYKKNYSGNYCVGCELFLRDKDMNENNECLIHKKPTELQEEENYFFRLSKYADTIKNMILENRVRIVPDFRKNEVLAFIDE